MASALLSHLQNLWPFSLRKGDDLKVSNGLVRRLSISKQTKEFVFAIQDPDSQSVVYILAAQHLSEQSALDARCLIKEVQPDAVVAQIASSAFDEIQAEESCSRDDEASSFPTSSLEVLKGCFVKKYNKVRYENLAGIQVLREIFGVGFCGHFLAAKRAAEEVGSRFLLLESPFRNACADQTGEADAGNTVPSLQLQPSGLLPGKLTSVVSSGSRRLCVSDSLQTELVKSLSSLALLMEGPDSYDSVKGTERGSGECQPRPDYKAPSFAQSVYPLLSDLHDIFIDLPSIGKALLYAQKMLVDVDKGEPVDTQLLSEVYTFRIAVEGLRMALNNAARSPLRKVDTPNPSNFNFEDLPSEEKCHVLLAQAIKSQTKNFKSIVAIVDASSLAGLRKYWNCPLPTDIADLANQCFREYEGNWDIVAEHTGKKKLLADKPVVAVGAGATAALGASSLSKAVPASTFVKLVTYKVPVSLKIGLAQMQRMASVALSKILAPSKIMAPNVASSGFNASAMKATASAEKIRLVAHSVIASAERTSFQAMRTAFYEIMRRRGRAVGVTPWAAFGCSVATCTGLLVYGDGIECIAESVPSAPMIASLGRGLRSLHQASEVVRQTSNTKIQESINSLMYRLKKIKFQ